MAFLKKSMKLDCLLDRFRSFGAKEALVIEDRSYSYEEIEAKRMAWLGYFTKATGLSGQVLGLQGSFSLDTIGFLLAAWSLPSTVALIPKHPTDEPTMMKDAQIEMLFRFGESKPWERVVPHYPGTHPLLKQLSTQKIPGLILFTSGSSGRPKAVLHNVEKFIAKFRDAKKSLRTLAFLLFDHVAGLDTLLYTLASGGVLVIPPRRDPGSVCRTIQEKRVEVLPASPSFLRLLCISGEIDRHDLSSLKMITYGSEPMDQSSLKQLQERFPHVRLMQKYGSTEFGVPRMCSREDNTLWIKIHSETCKIKVLNNLLWVKGDSAMMGYLNADYPGDEHGWFPTGDLAIIDGEWIRILGRKSETINVGGEKVFPSEIKSIILENPNVQDVVVRGENHPLMGEIVVANLCLFVPKEEQVVLKEIRHSCKGRLAPYKIPIKVAMASSEELRYFRDKKNRIGEINEFKGC